MEKSKVRIRNGIVAYDALQKLRKDRTNESLKKQFTLHANDLGYGLLLKRHHEPVVGATDAHINQAAADTIPNVTPLFWSFRIMVGIGLFFILFFAFAFYTSAKKNVMQHRWFLRLAVASFPLPWIAGELGWFVAENGRQPWAIEGVLPTYLATSSVSAGNVLFTLIGFVVFYTALAFVDAYLMVKYVKIGPLDAFKKGY